MKKLIFSLLTNHLCRRSIAAVLAFSFLMLTFNSAGQQPLRIDGAAKAVQTELNRGWVFKQAVTVSSGKNIGKWAEPGASLKGWQPATVPGTVLTSLLNNGKVPDPFYGMNNNQIPDIYATGSDYYTYWFVKDFTISNVDRSGQYYLHLRGVNYGFDAYLNGHKLNDTTLKGMFMRRHFNITRLLNKEGSNRLAIIVYPPDPVGNPNGGQGGDGTIAKNVAHQYVAGWDWIQPVRDRNTGIWDKVFISCEGPVALSAPHVVTRVPGKRMPSAKDQAPAIIHTTVDLHNRSDHSVTGTVSFHMAGSVLTRKVTIDAGASSTAIFDTDTLHHPKLWWPSGMESLGDHHLPFLYPASFQFTLQDGNVSDSTHLLVGVRQIDHRWNDRTRSTEVLVNGQPLFIRGGNWIVSDAMLRLSPERYDAEVRFHRDMGLNLIRVWGGALTERPEFYEACDKYGLLVMQDFWGSGDCNGRWQDPKKKDDIWTRRGYPDDHGLFLASAADQIRMLRNYASLAIWCGGNEITLAPDLQSGLQDSLLPLLDTTRWYIDFSNSDSMSFNTLGGNGDGPYGIQPIEKFWTHRTFPFNSEIGSVGIGDIISLKRFLPTGSLPGQLPTADQQSGYDKSTLIDSVWQYHKYIGYGSSVDRYGQPENTAEFARICQLINYNQYRALMEGFTARQWDWYTGFIIWKTQNPWTAMRGQMYDYYLDPNACLYGLKKAAEKVHLMFNPADSSIYIVNNTYQTVRNLIMEITVCSYDGATKLLTRTITQAIPQHPKLLLSVAGALSRPEAEKGLLLSLKLLDLHKNIISENIYWTRDKAGNYSGLQRMKASSLQIRAHWTEEAGGQKRIEVQLYNPKEAAPAFFNRISVVDKSTQKRILPTFYSDNYLTILPGDAKTIYVDPPSETVQEKMIHSTENTSKFEPTASTDMEITVEGWNLPKKNVRIR